MSPRRCTHVEVRVWVVGWEGMGMMGGVCGTKGVRVVSTKSPLVNLN